MDTTKMRLMSCMGIGVVIYWDYHIAIYRFRPTHHVFTGGSFVAYGGLRAI